jgi:hypothetical protein
MGNRRHLTLELRRGLDNDVLVGAGHDKLERAQPVLVQRDEADVRHVAEHRGDPLLQLPLPQLAVRLRDVGDGEGRKPHLLLAGELDTAVHEDGAHFRHLA